MAEQGHVIFISHATKDRKVAEALCKAIEARGDACWIAVRDIPGSRNYQDMIVDAINRAKVMVLVFSQNANNSTEIKKEIALASRLKLPVIPVRIEDVVPQGGFAYELATRQYVDLFSGWDKAVDAIVAQARRIDGGGEDYRPLPRRQSRVLVRGLVGACVVAVVIGVALFVGSRPWSIVSTHVTDDDPLSAYAAAPPANPSTQVNDFKVAVRLGTTWVDRVWNRSFKQWVETDDHGTKTSLTTIRRITLGDCPGSVLLGDEERTKLVFVPDKGCSGMPLKISYEGGRSWGVAGNMTEVH